MFGNCLPQGLTDQHGVAGRHALLALARLRGANRVGVVVQARKEDQDCSSLPPLLSQVLSSIKTEEAKKGRSLWLNSSIQIHNPAACSSRSAADNQ
jgi:hypothetical protein